MLQLFLIRHAKSSWKDLTLDDFERPLNKRGQASIEFMSKRLLEKKILPDAILSSPAKRAKLTSKHFAQALFVENLLYDLSIYDASAPDLLQCIKAVEKRHKSMFLIGHNPSLNALAYELVKFEQNIPTCGMVHIVFNCQTWSEINPLCAKLENFEFPKKYPEFLNLI